MPGSIIEFQDNVLNHPVLVIPANGQWGSGYPSGINLILCMAKNNNNCLIPGFKTQKF